MSNLNHLYRIAGRKKPLKIFSKSVKGVALTGRLFTKKWKFVIFWGRLGPHYHPPLAIEAKFGTAKRTLVPVGPAKFDLNRCNESPLLGENPDFWPVSKFNTGSLPLRGILPVIIIIRRNNNKCPRHLRYPRYWTCLGHLK